MRRYLEDFAAGDRFAFGSATISREEAIAFARAFDPQPFHLDDAAARDSLFGTLVVSGWHTAAVAMRLIVDGGALRETGVIGNGIDELRWLAPVVPGDTLAVRGEVVEIVPPQGSRRRGTMRVRFEALNQNGAIVYSAIANLILPARP